MKRAVFAVLDCVRKFRKLEVKNINERSRTDYGNHTTDYFNHFYILSIIINIIVSKFF